MIQTSKHFWIALKIKIDFQRSVNNTATSINLCRIWVTGNQTVQKEMVLASYCDNTTLTNNIGNDIPKFKIYAGTADARSTKFFQINLTETKSFVGQKNIGGHNRPFTGKALNISTKIEWTQTNEERFWSLHQTSFKVQLV